MALAVVLSGEASLNRIVDLFLGSSAPLNSNPVLTIDSVSFLLLVIATEN